MRPILSCLSRGIRWVLWRNKALSQDAPVRWILPGRRVSFIGIAAGALRVHGRSAWGIAKAAGDFIHRMESPACLLGSFGGNALRSLPYVWGLRAPTPRAAFCKRRAKTLRFAYLWN